MFIDLSQIDSSRPIETDVCIVGAGPAGLALFVELDQAGVDVCLIESGGLTPSEGAQALCAGESETGYPFEATRVRAFGGTTHLWSGICVRPEELDLEGWPLSAVELEPYFDRAAQFFGFPALSECDVPQLGLASPPSSDLEIRPLRMPDELRLGATCLDRARQSTTSKVLLGTTAVEIVANESGNAIESVELQTTDGLDMTLRAARIIVAGGGIECARLLLASRRRSPSGVGNEHDMVGRCFMERPHVAVGEWIGGDSHELQDSAISERPIPGGRAVAALALSPDVRRREQLPGCWLRAYRLHPTQCSAAVRAHQQLWAGITTGEAPLKKAQLLREMASDPMSLFRYYGWRATQKIAPSAAPPGAILLVATVEPAPKPQNRITLSDRLDRFGSPLARLELPKIDDYKTGLDRSLGFFEKAFEALGIGRVERSLGDPRWPADVRMNMSAHHMGATRMDDDPKRGVVDRDCRVHGVENLWIASSSVFPVAGSANPTLTIVALAIRLADTLKRRRET